ncbi:MAG: PAS domain S-box protein [Anaerolineaceae bacterium]
MKKNLKSPVSPSKMQIPVTENRLDLNTISFSPTTPAGFGSPDDFRQAVESFAKIFQQHPTPMWIYDQTSLKILAVNDAAVENYGYTSSECLDMRIQEVFSEDGSQQLQKEIAISGTSLPHLDLWPHRFKNGTLIDVYITGQNLEWRGIRSVFITAQDVTPYARMEEKLRHLNRLYSILSDINQAIVRQRDMPVLYKQICSLAVHKAEFALAWISLVDGNDGVFKIAACESESSELQGNLNIQVGRPASEIGSYFGCCLSKETLLYNGLDPDAPPDMLSKGFLGAEIRSFVVLPLVIQDQVRGTINLFSHQPGIFDPQEKDLLVEIGEDVSFAIEHADQERMRHEAEIELERKTAELDRYFESNLDMLCIADTRGYFRRLNPEWEKTLGYPLQELEGKPFLDYVHPDDLPATLEAINQLSGQEVVNNFTNRYRCKDGSYRWIEWRSFPHGDLIYAAARDMTAHKQAEANMHLSQRQISAFIDLFPGPAFIKDHNRRILYSSSAYNGYFGIQVSEWVGHTMEELFPGEIADQMRERDENLLATKRPTSFEIFVPYPKKQWLLTTLFPIPDNEGETGIAGFSMDVTALKERENEIQTLFDLSTSLRSVQTREEVINMVTQTVRTALNADSGQVILPDEERKNFVIVGVDGHVSTALGYRFPIGEGLSSWVWKTGQTYISDDYATDEHHSHTLDENGLIGPSIFTPLRSENDLLGVLFVSRLRSQQVQTFTPEEVRLFIAIGEMAGNALRRIDLYTDALRRLKHVQALRNIDLAITGDMDLNLTLDQVLNEVKNELEVDTAAVLLLDESTETLKYAAGHGFKTNIIEKTCLRLGEGLAGEAALDRTMKYSHHLSLSPDLPRSELQQAESFEVYYAAPMISKGRLLGVMEVFHRSEHSAIEEWKDLLVSMAGRAAIAVDNARLISDLQQSNQVLRQAYDATILGWSRAMDLRDEDTEGHTQRVTEMTLNLSRAMGIAEEELIHVRRGALLHDMGKLGVPDNILRKPGPLTEEEWAIMRCHPLYTYDMLSPIEFLRPALDIPFYHHEKWDGSGYPSGLKGEDIPLAARIFAVIDVYDALSSDRPYRSAWPKDKVMDHIRTSSGSHFDPQVVELFLKIMDKPTLDPFLFFEQ